MLIPLGVTMTLKAHGARPPIPKLTMGLWRERGKCPLCQQSPGRERGGAEPVKPSVFVQMRGQMTSPLVRSVQGVRREARALLKGCLPPGIMRMGIHAPVATEA